MTYDGAATVPVNAGDYAVQATLSDPKYQGTATRTLAIAQTALTAKSDDQTRLPNMADPSLQLNTTTMTWSVVGANDDWGGSAELATAMSQAGMGPLAADSKDAVLLLELQPGIYTAQLSGLGDTTGIGLVEVYEAP